MQQEPVDAIAYVLLASFPASMLAATLARTVGPWKLSLKRPGWDTSGIGCLGTFIGFFMSAVILGVAMPNADIAKISAVPIGAAWIPTSMLGSALLVRVLWKRQSSRSSDHQPATESADRATANRPRARFTSSPRAGAYVAPPGGVFISYRREDTAHVAGRISERLHTMLDGRSVFTDVDSIAPGADFVVEIERAVQASQVMLVLIGDQWLTAHHPDGRRRLDNPEDFVRLEVEEGLRLDLHVIPVLVDRATMPSPTDLPPSMVELAYRTAFEVRHTSFGRDANHLLEVVRGALGMPRAVK